MIPRSPARAACPGLWNCSWYRVFLYGGELVMNGHETLLPAHAPTILKADRDLLIYCESIVTARSQTRQRRSGMMKAPTFDTSAAGRRWLDWVSHPALARRRGSRRGKYPIACV